ncbi:zinc-binding dehydrogenase [Planobispora takensis]|nr:zinc-binding dehydrogenase [Planobispora takensis]
MPRRILVTGATGTVGRQVTAQLLEAGAEVRALIRRPADLPAGAEGVRGDLAVPGSLRAAAEGVGGVFLLWPFAAADGLQEVLETLSKAGAGRVVYLSSAAVREHERRAERLIGRSGLAWTILRPHAFAANALRWAGGIRTAGVVREPYGGAAASPVHERDIAAVAVRALTGDGHCGAVYELTGPHSLTQAEQVRIIGEATGRPVRWQEASPREARRRMLARGWPAEVADDVLRAQAGMAAGPSPVTAAVREVTGVPARTFRSWAAEHAHAFSPVMRAARIHAYGGPEVIRHEEAPIPEPGPGEVLVRVAATSFNPSEAALRSGLLRQVLPVAFPYTLGWDVSGTVAAVGPGVTRWAPGDRVIGRLDGGGAAAEYVAAPAGVLVAAPVSVPAADAAAIPVAALTAWQAVFEHAKAETGHRVLVNGAGGGVGGFTVQLARLAGATVIATASARSAAAVRSLGADQVVDYTAEPLPDDVDAVINLAAVGPEDAARLVALVRPGGVAVSAATPLPAAPPLPDSPRSAPPPSVTVLHFVARNDPGQLARIVSLLDTGELTVDVSESRPLAEAAAVHRRSEAGRTRGKIVLIPQGNVPDTLFRPSPDVSAFPRQVSGGPREVKKSVFWEERENPSGRDATARGWR